MKGSAFIWLVGAISFVSIGLIWIALGTASSYVSDVGDTYITDTQGSLVYNILSSIVDYWPIVILLAIVIYMIINSQRTSEVYG